MFGLFKKKEEPAKKPAEKRLGKEFVFIQSPGFRGFKRLFVSCKGNKESSDGFAKIAKMESLKDRMIIIREFFFDRDGHAINVFVDDVIAGVVWFSDANRALIDQLLAGNVKKAHVEVDEEHLWLFLLPPEEGNK